MPLPILIGLTAFGIGMQVTGQIKAGNAAKRAGEFNAQGLEAQAEDALGRGQAEANQLRSQVRQLMGTQRAAFAGQNVRVGTGSPLDVAADTAYVGELDAQQRLQNAAREAWGLRQDAQSERMGGSAAQSASRWQAAATVTQGATSLMMQRYGWQRTGR